MSHFPKLFTSLNVCSPLMLCYMYSYFPAMLPLVLGSESSILNILYTLVRIKYYLTVLLEPVSVLASRLG